jgi:(4S)-4-hydroxy-5-phosphonooxypentane-2,3-dione isomerase
MTSDKTAFVVIAEFVVRPEHRDRFLAIAQADARESVANEPGCRHFDAVVPEDRPDHVVLYEVYDDRAAFEAHLQQPHYFPFRDAVPAMTVGDPVVRFCTRVG